MVIFYQYTSFSAILHHTPYTIHYIPYTIHHTPYTIKGSPKAALIHYRLTARVCGLIFSDSKSPQNKDPHQSEANEHQMGNIDSLLSPPCSHAITADNEQMARTLHDHLKYESILLYRSTIFLRYLA